MFNFFSIKDMVVLDPLRLYLDAFMDNISLITVY